MCGGSGTRMWPESRESLPKQFIPLIGRRSTFQTIVSAVSDPAVFDSPVVITNFEYRFRVAEQLREIGAAAVILLEPDRRDSAAAVGAAAAFVAAGDPKTVVAVLAADHVFENGKQFAQLCAQAQAAASAGEIVTFGVTHDHPAIFRLPIIKCWFANTMFPANFLYCFTGFLLMKNRDNFRLGKSCLFHN